MVYPFIGHDEIDLQQDCKCEITMAELTALIVAKFPWMDTGPKDSQV